MFIKFLLRVIIALLYVYPTARNFHEFIAILSTITIASFILSWQFILPQSTISLRWSLCSGFHYVHNVVKQSFVWNVVRGL